MFELSTLILTGFSSLIAGALIGTLLTKTLRPQEQQNRELELRLRQAEDKLSTYQDQVTVHFAETSQLINKLTQSYKEVHEHLASSALTLTNPDISRQLIEAGDGTLGESTPSYTHADPATLQPPRDWAPKNPGQSGQLSEDFGLSADDSEHLGVSSRSN